MNKIAQAGVDLGNFFFIDTRLDGYKEEVGKCLSESLDIALEGANSIKLKLSGFAKFETVLPLENNYLFAEEEVDGMPIISGVSLSVQCLMLSNNINNLSAELIVKDKRHNFVV
jgi:hypothetical protein